MGINILLREGMGCFYMLLWEWDGNGNTVMGMGGNRIGKVISAHLYVSPKNLRKVKGKNITIKLKPA